MTRIYTNVPSMIARTNLTKNMSALQTSLERLSTGFKINSGKDDPAGLIASEMLRSDITGIKVAIKNTERANMMIATADSALNEVTNLLNDIRGLVTEAASTGTMSAEMIYANQLQVDASLDAIDRISAQTTFMGQKLLDGSLDFNLTGIDRNNLKGLAVNQATFGADKGPLNVTINVREAAEKAALYYNQPALAEAIVLQWGGNYGYAMQSFEKGATVAEIAEIVNKQADATGVVAEVGSDALAGLLYVSSLGPDNDMIIQAGLAGLNAGNVEIKYLKGTSDGVQVKYEEPVTAGAPAKILVYLQTEAYSAAFADDVDTTWTLDANGKLVPKHDNNALKFEANIEGAQYNNANIYYVDGSLFDPEFYTTSNKTGTAGMPYTYYNDNAQSSTAVFGNVADGGSNINETGALGAKNFFNGVGGGAFLVTDAQGATRTLNEGEYFSIQSKAGGKTYNDVNIQFVTVPASDTLLSGRNASALYSEQKDIYGNTIPGGKTLTIYCKEDGTTSLQDVQDALKLERHIGEDGSQVVGAFELKNHVGSAASLSQVTIARPSGTGHQTVATSNTNNTGGAAGTLYIVLPPDGKMPARPATDEVMGVTAKAIGDGNYLMHDSPAWDGYAFEFIKGTGSPTNDVTVSFDASRNDAKNGYPKGTITITANADATYEDILKALNSGLRSVTGNSVSTSPVWTDGTDNIYLANGDLAFDNVPIKFVSSGNTGTAVSVTGSIANGITITADSGADYDAILVALNEASLGGPITGSPQANGFTWDNGTGSVTPGAGITAQTVGAFPPSNIITGSSTNGHWITNKPVTDQPLYWSDAYGNPKVPAVPRGVPSLTATNVVGLSTNSITTSGTQVYLKHNSPAFDGWTIKWNALGAGGGSAVNISSTGTEITINYGATATYDQILAALNGTWAGGTNPAPGSFSWADATGAALPGTAGTPGTTANVDTNLNLTYTDAALNGYTIVFDSTGTGVPAAIVTGMTVTIAYDGTDASIMYDDLLTALNGTWTGGTNPAPGNFTWAGTAAATSGTTQAVTTATVNTSGAVNGTSFTTTAGPGATTSSVRSVGTGTITVKSTLPIGDFYLVHSDTTLDAYSITFAKSGNPGGAVSVVADTANGKLTVTIGNDATYDQILAALNADWVDSSGTAVTNPALGGFSWINAQGTSTRPGIPSTLVNSTASGTYQPYAYSLDGRSTLVSDNGTTNSVIDDLYLYHSNPLWDDIDIVFAPETLINAPGSNAAGNVEISSWDGKKLVVRFDTSASYEDIIEALNNPTIGTPVTTVGWFGISAPLPPADAFKWVDSRGVEVKPVGDPDRYLNPSAYDTSQPPATLLNKTVSTGAVERLITANDIVAMFDLSNPLSRGSERAASLFTVNTTVDNDGKGLIQLYDYWVDSNGKLYDHAVDSNGVAVAADAPNAVSRIYTKTAFEKIFQNGNSGGEVITTAAELVTVLNNSAYWSMVMCPELISELAKENNDGKYYDATDPPVITARLAPGNHGLFAVSTFEEVAYYGNPNDGTALQFLGDINSPNIRFVKDGPNTPLSIDRTTVPAVVAQSQAVLTAQDSGASLTITAAKKGEDYDDVQFVFKRVSEDIREQLSPDRKDGWVEYDPGRSRAEAQATFKDAATNQPVLNSAFFITATERGDVYNNASIVMRLDDALVDDKDGMQDGIYVMYDTKTNQLRISIDSAKAASLTTNDVIAAINNTNSGFTAQLSFAEEPTNTGMGSLANIGLSTSRYIEIANTGETGGHVGGTVTVWLASEEMTGPAVGTYNTPTQEDIVRLINNDPVVGKLFTAKAYNTVQDTDGKQINFVKDGPIVSKGGLLSPALITVHLATDQNGNILTTAKDLETWWNQQDPALVDNISVSIVRPAGAVWDECNDPYGGGLLAPTVEIGDCDQWIINDIQFVGWNDNVEQQHYVATKATGVMTSQRGINSSYQMVAKQDGPELNGYTIEYINDDTLTGHYADNFVEGSDLNPCDEDPYTGAQRDALGQLITPTNTSEKGLRLSIDPATKKITINVRFGATTAYDIEQLIESNAQTRNLFQVIQLGDGTGLIDAEDDTLLTKDGALAPGNLNGAKLLFGEDATDYYLVFKSREYGSGQFVDVRAVAKDGGSTTFKVSDASGQVLEKSYGKDVDAQINGMKAVGTGLDVSLNTSSLSLNFTFSEAAGTTTGWNTAFSVTGGGATFQVGPDVVSRQQITMGIRSINTVQLGGASGVLNELRSGQSADLTTDTNKAFRIVEESLLAITSIRGRLGTMQRATLETNINVLNDTLDAITEAESQIRDTDFAEETSNLTRAQILVQANMNTLGIANQIPNYMLSLLGR